jgi:type I restriction enzyme S subunit
MLNGQWPQSRGLNTEKNKMPEIIENNISIIETKELERFSRIDAEYYHPKYLALEQVHKKGIWSPIGRHLKSCEYGLSIAMNTEGHGYGILRMDNLQDGFAFDDELKHAPISDEVFEKYKLRKDDVLFNRVNSEEFVGRTGIYKLSGNHVFASYLVRCQTKESELLPDYLNTFLNTKYGILSIRRMSRRAVNQANVNAQELKAIKILLAPFGFQEEIKNLLEHSHSLFDSSKNLYAKAESLLLEELGIKDIDNFHQHCYDVSSADTVIANRIDAEYFQPRYEKVIEVIKKYSDGFSLIKDEFIQVKDSFSKENDKVYSYIEIGSVSIASGSIECLSLKGNELPANAKIITNGGEVIVSKVRPTRGAVTIIPEDWNGFVCSGAFVVLKDNGILRKEVLNVFLKSFVGKELLGRPVTGTSYPTIDDQDILDLPLPLIKLKVQDQIADLIHQSYTALRQAKKFLEEAKRKVEKMIEKGTA